MVDFINSNTYLDSFSSGQRSRSALADAGVARARHEQALEDGAVNVIRARQLDENVAKQLGGLRTASVPGGGTPMPATAGGVAAARSSNANTMTPPPGGTSAPAAAPAAAPAQPTAHDYKTAVAQAQMQTPGFRMPGATAMAQAQDSQDAQEAQHFSKMVELSRTNPEMAIQYAQQNGLLNPGLEVALRNAEVRKLFTDAHDRWRGVLAHDPVQYSKAVNHEVQQGLAMIKSRAQSMQAQPAAAAQPAGYMPAATGGVPAQPAPPAMPVAPVTSAPLPEPTAFNLQAFPEKPRLIYGSGGTYEYNPNDKTTTEITSPTGNPIARASGGSGRGKSVWQTKHDAWLALYPGDVAGALQYAQGGTQMRPEAMRKAARISAEKTLLADITRLTPPTEAEIQAKANEIYAYLTQDMGAAQVRPAQPVPPPAGAPAATPPAADPLGIR